MSVDVGCVRCGVVSVGRKELNEVVFEVCKASSQGCIESCTQVWCGASLACGCGVGLLCSKSLECLQLLLCEV